MGSLIRAIANMIGMAMSVATTRTATYNGTSADAQPLEGDASIFVLVSATGGTSPTLNVKLQDSADNSSFADVSGQTLAQITADGIYQLTFEVSAVRRYVRVVGTIAGTSPTFSIAELLVGPKKYQP